MSAYFQTEIDGVTFRWHGGEYIDSGYIATEQGAYETDYGHAVGEFVAQECINVWDYATGAPFIERTLEAFEAHCVEYMTTQAEVWAAAADNSDWRTPATPATPATLTAPMGAVGRCDPREPSAGSLLAVLGFPVVKNPELSARGRRYRGRPATHRRPSDLPAFQRHDERRHSAEANSHARGRTFPFR